MSKSFLCVKKFKLFRVPPLKCSDIQLFVSVFSDIVSFNFLNHLRKLAGQLSSWILRKSGSQGGPWLAWFHRSEGGSLFCLISPICARA